MNKQNRISTDVLIIGGGPSGLSTAIRLSDLAKKQGQSPRIMLVDNGSSIGSHILSGAIINPESLKELLPEAMENIPFDSKVTKDTTMYLTENGSIKSPVHPPYMSNKGNYVASLGDICRYLATVAEEKGVEIYPGFSVNELLYNADNQVIGAKTIDTGVSKKGEKEENYVEGTSIDAKITILAEGTRGPLTKELVKKFDLQKGKNPQVYSLGCKELWSIPEGRIQPGEVYHTMGYPLNLKEFGGGFIYGLTNNRVALGLVVGLDIKDPSYDFHKAFQIWKTHPFISKFLKGGTILEAGAKTLPEGGYYSMPKPYSGGVMIVGDSAGFLAMPALKGIHLAIYSGMLAAETALEALTANDYTATTLKSYESKIAKSQIYKQLYPVRNFRQAMAKGIINGGFQFGMQWISGGAGLLGRLNATADSDETQALNKFIGVPFAKRFAGKLEADRELTFDKVTDVYYSGTAHDEEQPLHLHVNNPDTFNKVNIEQYGAPAQYYCPAEVYELHVSKDGKKEMRFHAENCLHCKTCDIKEPCDGITWQLPYGGNGPEYQHM